jgi:hypothetical protein
MTGHVNAHCFCLLGNDTCVGHAGNCIDLKKIKFIILENIIGSYNAPAVKKVINQG